MNIAPKYARPHFFIARCGAAGVAFYATAAHSYNFYIFTRWVVFGTCCYGLWLNRNRIWSPLVAVYGVVAVLFNPLLPFHFARSTWRNLDIAAGVILLASLLFHNPPNDSNADDTSR